ncbi:unnamed protein product [marine sediment metagenome]|uniref:Uncharacterized protein n=1 Tax=marine sediment metagenome TaxID=412755 RepID=X1V2K8_9ZZZZ
MDLVGEGRVKFIFLRLIDSGFIFSNGETTTAWRFGTAGKKVLIVRAGDTK